MAFGSVMFPTGTYTVTRTAQGTRVAGHYASGTTQTFPIVANVQAVTSELLRDLPEGMRAEETRVVYTITELRSLADTAEPDTIAIDGYVWRVMRAQRFRVFAQRTRAWVERVRPVA